MGIPRFGKNHCVRTATNNHSQTKFDMFTFCYLPTPSLRRNVIIGHQSVNPD